MVDNSEVAILQFPMTLPNALSIGRLVLSPVFFLFFFLPRWSIFPQLASVVILWLLFGLIEITDLLDGSIARRLGQTSDTGKLLDPFADSLSRLTYFFCFTIAGLMPVWIFIVLLYRDLTVGFIRLIMSRKGISMGARLSGKLKAWVYAVSGVAGLLTMTISEIPRLEGITESINIAKFVVFLLAGSIAIWSLIDYFTALRKRGT